MVDHDIKARFRKAIGILVDEKPRIKERLMIAFAAQLADIHPTRDLPEGLVDEFERIKYALSDADMPYGYGDRAWKRVQAMTEDEASDLARSLYQMFLTLHAIKSQQQTEAAK